MKITVIGSGTGTPSPRRKAPALLVETGRRKMLFDCGPDTLHGLAEAGCFPGDLDRVWITHLHPDHSLGIPHLLFACRYSRPPRRRPLEIAGPAGLKRALAGFRCVYPDWLEAREYELTVRELAPGRYLDEDIAVTALRVVHGPESLGYRLCAPGKGILAYTGDSAYCPALVELGAGADLLVAEASFPAGRAVPGHLTPELAGRVAREAGARELVITHLYPLCDSVDVHAQAAREFAGRIHVAEDGMTVTVGEGGT
ncbi:MAG TPA: MBL fold metallo-hydrolase [bacterium]|nr:MBL fold metallo-hydrolase [bacterium]HPQ65110.1 MBL fold metallo-hydrolase [bacterium]